MLDISTEENYHNEIEVRFKRQLESNAAGLHNLLRGAETIVRAKHSQLNKKL